MKKIIMGLILTLIFIMVVSTSGCTYLLSDNSSLIISKEGIFIETPDNSSSLINSNKTFSKGGISFVYPGNFYEGQIVSNEGSGASIENLAMLNSPDGDNIFVTKSAVLYSGEDLIEIFKKSLEESGAKILKEDVKTINGLTIYEILLTNPENGETLYIVTKKDHIQYEIQLNGDKLFDKYSSGINQIESTIKIE
jgi:hypothetical protein